MILCKILLHYKNPTADDVVGVDLEVFAFGSFPDRVCNDTSVDVKTYHNAYGLSRK